MVHSDGSGFGSGRPPTFGSPFRLRESPVWSVAFSYVVTNQCFSFILPPWESINLINIHNQELKRSIERGWRNLEPNWPLPILYSPRHFPKRKLFRISACVATRPDYSREKNHNLIFKTKTTLLVLPSPPHLFFFTRVKKLEEVDSNNKYVNSDQVFGDSRFSILFLLQFRDFLVSGLVKKKRKKRKK